MADAHVGQQGTLTRIWAKRGTRHRAPRDTRYQWAFASSLEPVAFTGSLLGAVCPARGAAVGLVLPFVSTEAMNAHLAEISRNVAVGAHAVLILDGAGWHGANALVVPDNLSLLTLPP
jgi:acetyltransferase-like isoleucine patch superfamily enzyme